tara:strand:+ start:526 stop:867 length:342 start_codon:yes stop_codon:yes gene_type:complete
MPTLALNISVSETGGDLTQVFFPIKPSASLTNTGSYRSRKAEISTSPVTLDPDGITPKYWYIHNVDADAVIINLGAAASLTLAQGDINFFSSTQTPTATTGSGTSTIYWTCWD